MTTPCFQMEEKRRKQQQPTKTDYWLQPNIVVKVVTKRLGEKYHKRKAVVTVTALSSFKNRPEGKRTLLFFVAGSERQIFGGGEDDRLWRQTEAGPDSRGDGHPCTR